MKTHRNAGQFDLRGKKEKQLSCRCCDVYNWKERERIREIKQEIRNIDINSPDNLKVK